MASEPEKLRGLRVLVVEDVMLVADAIGYQLESWGCAVIGPVSRLRPALSLARAASLDGALLDVNLAGESSFPVAEALRARGVPFVFLTGYDAAAVLPPEYQDVPRLEKPVDDAVLGRTIEDVFGPAETPAPRD